MDPQNKNTDSELMLTDSKLFIIDYNKVKQNNPELKDLRLSSYGINSCDAIFMFKALIKNNKVDYIDLDNNIICDKAAPSIAYALEHNKTIKVIDLDRNQITNIGAKKIIESLKHNTTLEQLYFDNNKISNNLLLKIEILLQRNRKLRKKKKK